MTTSKRLLMPTAIKIALALLFCFHLLVLPTVGGTEFDATIDPESITINNVFVDAYITEALRDVAFEAGVSIIADTGVQGFITLDLVDVPLETALAMILAPGGYSFAKIDDTTYVVGPATPGSPMFHLLSVSERYSFQYIKADSARRLMPTEYNMFVKFDDQTNSALIQAGPDQVKRIKADLAKIDVPPRQIVVEALVTEVSNVARERLGIDWSLNDPAKVFPNSYFTVSDLIGTVGYVSSNGFDRFLASLRTLVDDGEAEIRASSRVAALDGKEASIFVGTERYYRIVTGSEANPVTRLQPIDAGVSLRIIPQIAENGDITLFIEPSVSDVNGTSNDGLPEINQRNVSTTVRVRDGQTIAIGGLLQKTENSVVSKVPILGDLPILSNLFRSTTTITEENEVLVFITPRLMNDM